MTVDAKQQTLSNLVWEGPIPLSIAIAVLVATTLFSAWMLWRERNVIGAGSATLFWLLRVTISSVVIWMLLGPTNLVHEQNATSPGIAILVDSSDSMKVVDRLSPHEIAPWNSLSQTTPASVLLVEGEQMLIATQITLDRVRELSTNVNRQSDSPLVRRLCNGIITAHQRAVHHWESLAKHVPPDPPEIATRGARIRASVLRMESEILPILRKLAERPNATSPHDITESVAAMESDLAQIERRAHGWLHDLQSQQEEAVSDVSAGIATGTPSRHDLVAATMNAVETHSLSDVDASCPIHRFTFDEKLTLLQGKVDWKHTDDSDSSEKDSQDSEQHSQDSEKDSQGASHATTNIAATLEQLHQFTSSHPLRTAILVSDGAHNSTTGSAPQDVAGRLDDIKFYVVPSGTSTLSRDVAIHRVKAPRLVAVGDAIVIESVISAIACERESCEVTIKHNGNVVERRKLNFVGDQVDEIADFTVPAQQIGPQEFELSVSPLDDEVSLENNVTTVTVEVMQDKIRLLIADHAARWEFRYLEQLFRRDKHVQCDTLLFSPEVVFTGDNNELTTLPTTVEGWSRYNVIILGDLDVQNFREASQRSLSEFVRDQGGNVIVIAGQDNMPAKYKRQPLLDLLPVQQHSQTIDNRNGVVPRITAEGETNPALLIADRLPDAVDAWRRAFETLPIYFISEYSQTKPSAHTAMDVVPAKGRSAAGQDPPHAFMAWHQIGAGRIAYLSSPATWQLRNRRGDRLHHRFWGQMLRWITSSDRGRGSQRVRISTDKTQYLVQEPVEVTVRLTDDQGNPLPGMSFQVAAEGKSEHATTVDISEDLKISGRYVAKLVGLAPGTYRLFPQGPAIQQLLANITKASDISTQFTVTERIANEMADTRSNRSLLEQIAKVTGGQVVSPASIPEILHLSATDPEMHSIVHRTTLWNRWRYLWIVVGCLSTEWVVRKMKGLL